MKSIQALFCRCTIIVLISFLPQVLPASPAAAAERITFREVWAYLMAGEEQFFSNTLPVSDIGYFGAGLNSFGKLVGVPKPERLTGYGGRVHLVLAETGNAALTHFSLNPDYPVRAALIQDLVLAATPFDGIQIDFEAISARDRDNFLSFLQEIKQRIPGKILSVALPARRRTVDDAYDYARVAAIADRVIVMAYDEHWSGGIPGSIASLDWCKEVSRYALSTIGTSKLVMGLPFYGRAWAETNLSKAYKHSTLSTLIAEKAISRIERRLEIPYFEYEQTVRVQVYFEDRYSLVARLWLYRNAAVQNVSFWRLGQEDPTIWQQLTVLP